MSHCFGSVLFAKDGRQKRCCGTGRLETVGEGGKIEPQTRMARTVQVDVIVDVQYRLMPFSTWLFPVSSLLKLCMICIDLSVSPDMHLFDRRSSGGLGWKVVAASFIVSARRFSDMRQVKGFCSVARKVRRRNFGLR